ncbi:MAG: hypothetical protein FJ387_03285 [Verrucomicrobia bacterium]|nr:hypothetical protein [Verrucomicrobiota bacterium]
MAPKHSGSIEVNFNQTLDLRRLTPETAALLRRIRCANLTFTRRNYYFSLNDARGLEALRERSGWLNVNGCDNVEFVCMYGYDTALAGSRVRQEPAVQVGDFSAFARWRLASASRRRRCPTRGGSS